MVGGSIPSNEEEDLANRVSQLSGAIREPILKFERDCGGILPNNNDYVNVAMIHTEGFTYALLRGKGWSFTDRQIRIIQLVGEGLEIKEIAANLDAQPSTIRTHLTRLIAKVGAGSRFGIARLSTLYSRFLIRPSERGRSRDAGKKEKTRSPRG
jgi:DNA-binding CsgD family transcriptional regulator